MSERAGWRILPAATVLSALVLLVGWSLAPLAQAANDFGAVTDPFSSDADFLPVDEAFVLSHAVVDGDTLVVRWEMPDGYYLYRHRLRFETRPESPLLLGDASIPEGKHKQDEFQGDVEVYFHTLEVRVPLLGTVNGQEVGIGYQGCAEAGLCYPPELRWVTLEADDAAIPAPAVRMAAPAGASGSETEDQSFTRRLAESGLWANVLLFLLAGVGLAFTPCVLPMVPILSSIIVGEGAALSRRRALTLSLAYVLGMAVTYAAIGVLVGLFGAEFNLQAKLQSPAVLVAFALVFVALSLSMFGLYDLALPATWQERLQRLAPGRGDGKHLSVAIMGAVSSLIVSPCVSAPLAGALVFISQTGDAWLGGLALLALGLGMGLPLLVMGAGGGQLLPRAGAWMNSVKAVFGVLLLGVAIWLVERIVPAAVNLALWGSLLVGSGVFMGALDIAPRSGWLQAWRALGVVLLVYGVLLLVGAASGASDPLQPLAAVTAGDGRDAGAGGELDWRAVNSLAELDSAISGGTQGLSVLDLYADWCISCKVMERRVFPKPEVAALLAGFQRLRIDLTADTDAHRALLQAFGLIGPPTLVFFDARGQELVDVRLQGEVDAATLARHLARVQTLHGA
ncbi:MAG: protein-disulfide reductase DsbD [Pseudomonadales bacterium]|nr:protein-disulfide reductase DsbD [Pseudomonadales bacterium]